MSVMNVRREVKTVNRADTTPPMDKNNEQHTSGAADFKQAYGDQTVGDVLNKVADPNYVDKTKKLRTAGNNQLDKDAFLKLMLTQMKYQDPTNPMQSHEMAAQLAQFTSLEQLNNIHTTLESMKNQQAPQSNYQALALIGKRVSGDSSKLTRAAGDTKHGVSFELLGDSTQVKVTIKDANGAPVRKLTFGELKKGQNTVEWNGLKDDGSAARPGEYRISVEGMASNGKKVFAKTDFSGRITGLNYTPEGPVLLVGTKSIKLGEVKKIEDAGPDDAAPPMGGLPMPLGAKTGATAQPMAAGQTAAQPAVLSAQGAKFMPLEPNSAAPVVAPVTVEQAPTTTPVASSGTANDVATGVKKGVAEAQKPVVKTEAPQFEPKIADDNVPPAEEGPPPGNIDSVPMASELLAKVAKAN